MLMSLFVSSLVLSADTHICGFFLTAMALLLVSFTGSTVLTQTVCVTKHFAMDSVSWMLIILSSMSFLFCLLSGYTASQTSCSMSVIVSALVLICGLFFSSTSWMSFYVFFELSLIPIFFLILGWGYQSERMIASKALFFYTFSSSMPLLLLILSVSKEGANFIHQIEDIRVSLGVTQLATIFFSGAFLVKLPMFFVHMWLPKAHVEAPVMGSMFLAAILLKMGGFGVLKVYALLSEPSMVLSLILSFSAWSFIVISLSCFQSSDMKVLIAFSSVSHMAVMLVLLVAGSESGVNGALMIMLGHGISSSMMFYLSYLVYLSSSTRSLILNKSVKLKGGIMNFMWCLACLGMLGGPPTSNLWFEVNAFFLLCLSMPSMMKMLFWAGLLTGVYSLMCLSSVYSGNSLRYQINLKPSLALDSLVSSMHLIILLSLVTLSFSL